ncbi:MAG: formyltransferase [Armatimonadota bacterium]
MRLVCLGYQLIGHAGLQYFLEETDDEVVAVFTHEDSPGEEIWWPSVAELATKHGVPVYTPDNINTPEWVERIRAMQPDFIVGFWYRNLVKQAVLDIPPGGCLNLHGSLLPKYRGRAPINWVLANGERETGMTLHYMVERADAGDIVGQAVIPIDDEDTALTLYQRSAKIGQQVLRAAWPLLRMGKAPRVPQDLSQSTVVGRRTPEDGCIDWAWPARKMHNLVRAVTHPYPGAFIGDGVERIFVWSAWPLPGLLCPNAPAPGTVCAVSDAGIEVAAGEGHLLLRRVQLSGEDELTGAEFAARYGIVPGSRLAP